LTVFTEGDIPMPPKTENWPRGGMVSWPKAPRKKKTKQKVKADRIGEVSGKNAMWVKDIIVEWN
jgi:hypothetical protein